MNKILGLTSTSSALLDTLLSAHWAAVVGVQSALVVKIERANGNEEGLREVLFVWAALRLVG